MRISRLIVALVAIVATIAVVAACGSSDTSDTHSHPKTTTVVKVKTVTAPTARTSTTPATTTSTTATTTTSAAGDPQCNVSDLTASELPPDGAAGTQILTFALTNTATAACDTYGWPGIGFVSSSGVTLPTTPVRVTRDVLGSTGKPIKMTLSPGQEASFRVVLTLSGGGSSCVNAPTIEVTPPNDTSTLTLKLKPAQPTCGKATVTPLVPGTSALPSGT